uniref:K Homology domain-containing protein n=1 Tax=Opuntia streptacantha TaxID=393608 RepID=A0A7C9APW3_OPUST
MSANVEQQAMADIHHVQNAAVTSSSTTSSNSTKISMFKGKAGFVIPKNKFSGSLVPLFRGGKRIESSDAATEENTKQLQRKTKWGPDLTQDISVRRGRALAYQARVDQITELLKLGSLNGDAQNSEVAGDVQDHDPTSDIDYEKLKTLELERREAIGEILKLNPNYKPPFDYQPVIREATVPIPIKEHPGFNFIGLVYGPDGDTQKRLEKETGTRMQVYGIKSETREKIEITASDSSEVLSFCDELYVRIAADTYEKVDAAAALLELLLSSVPGKSAAPTAPASASGDNMQDLYEVQDLATISAGSTPTASQEPAQGNMGPISTSSQGLFQQFRGSWFPTGQSNMPSGVGPVPSSMGFPFNPSPTQSAFTLRSAPPYGFGGSPQNIPMGPPRPAQVMQGPFMSPANSFGQAGPPRNMSAAISPSPSPAPLMGRLPIAARSPGVPGPQLGDHPLNPLSNSPGWAMQPAGTLQSVAPGSLIAPLRSSQGSAVLQSVASLNPPSIPSVPPQSFPSQVGPTSVTSFVSSQNHSSSAMPMPVQSFTPQAPLLNSPNTLLRPGQVPAPPPASRPQSGMSSPAVGPLNAPSFTPLGPAPTPRPPLPNSSDFTFLPQRPQGPPQSVSGPGMHFGSQRPPGPPQAQLPPPPQAPSFRPALQNPMLQHAGQNFPRPQMGPHPGQFGPPSPNTQMGPRNLGPVPQMPNAAGPFPPRMGHSPQYQQSYPAPPLSQPGGPFITNQHSNSTSRTQVYDPFSPTAAASAQGNNPSMSRRQDSDPEYEDLMASVGVK